jgi:biopolymer transport protein TolQ
VNDLNVLTIGFKQGAVVPALLWLMIASSVLSWAVILRTALDLRRERRGYQIVRRKLDDAGPGDAALRAVSTSTGDDGASRIVNAIIRHSGRHAPAKAFESARVAVKSAVTNEIERLRRSLPLLATISSVSPYLGLFGTVWGVMEAFGAFGGLDEQAAFAQVAPGIAQALVATGIGLAVAIPAAIAHNLFLARAGLIADNLDLIGEELLARLVDGDVLKRA